MPKISIDAGETISQLSDRIFNGDVLRFTELLDLNPNLDVFGELTQGIEIEIPDVAQILNYAKPQLSAVSETITGISSTVSAVVEKLPSQLQGYAKEAVELLGEINGVVGQAESLLGQAEAEINKYGDKPVKVVQWLLGYESPTTSSQSATKATSK
ncbi:hypothetical protein NIES4101_53550 [Calothrix sp. NIES-4101]|nr:hypothetical protein NIES4101_53550 [Calothrix sp. NIES-4101]